MSRSGEIGVYEYGWAATTILVHLLVHSNLGIEMRLPWHVPIPKTLAFAL
jgi:hypothetical protein